jgi:hypothetical protein
MSNQDHAEGTTERLNQQLREQSRSFPVNEQPQATLLTDDTDEGVDGTGVSWPSRTEEQQKLDKEEEKKYKYLADKFNKVAEQTADQQDDEGVDGTGTKWN